MKAFLTPEQRYELLHELKVERHAKYSDRIKTILLLDDGEKYNDIGIYGLVTDTYLGKKCYLSDKEKRQLSNYLQSKICMDSKEIVSYIQNNFDVAYSISGVTALLHSMGFTYKKTKAIPAKAKKADQELFIESYNQLKSQGGKIYFADSTHPHHNAVISYGWIKKGENFEVLSNSGRHRLNINGAVDIQNLDVITRTCDWVNADAICELLKAIRAKNPDYKKITLIMDNAAYNRSKKVKYLSNKLKIKLFYLPPYSPNLNPIERLWKFMKKKVLYNKYYELLSEFESACINFFRGIRQYREELKTLLTDNFQVIGT
jgi:transposase